MAAKTKKPSAADRTVSMFAAPIPTTLDERAVEVIEDDEKAERVPMELEVDQFRAQAFQGQEWTTRAFGNLDAPGNEYRVSHKGTFYYVETLAKQPGSASAYGYVGLMVHERDLFALTTVLVQAVRDKQAKDADADK